MRRDKAQKEGHGDATSAHQEIGDLAKLLGKTRFYY
tara:strand:- start:144 stop:251 length:108 start_codon:yes stop_codon:yes gene_type:complete